MSLTWEPIQDWSTFLRKSAFWVWYYGNHVYVDDVDAEEDPIEVLRELFGEEDPDDLYRLLGPGLARGDGTPGSALELPMPGGFTWRLQFKGWPAVHHHLEHPEFPEPVCLGWDDPHPKLPELPWREIRPLVVDTLERPQPARVPGYFVLPLLIPMVTWQPDEEDELRSQLGDAWTGSGILTPHQVQEVTIRLTTFPDDAPAPRETPTAVPPLRELFDAIRTHHR
ncbi:hypothetical protein [Yinghuangia sp. YIM S09857]|uniref:hypothetical protein n=1 Tax=Yinghuangia sp. YIM S09857 TaxID=3436929 RepID=UPI003F5349D5